MLMDTSLAAAKCLLLRTALTLCFSLPTSWAWTVLVAGRALPWQATWEWALIFACAYSAMGLRWWRYWRCVASLTHRSRSWLTAISWGAGPPAAVAASFLSASYLSDGVYGFFLLPLYRMQLLAGAAVFTVLLESLLLASATWLLDDGVSVAAALQKAVAKRGGTIVWCSLLAVGVLQGMAMSSPINDDIGKYSQAAVAVLKGSPYPVHLASSYLVQAGMSADSPALPGLPILLAISYAILGQTYFGLGVPLAALAAVFPIALYSACRSITGCGLIAYATAVFLTLFPVYQIHVLGTAVPDTLFVVALLLTAAAAAKAIETRKWWMWIGTGLGAGLAANSRPEGLTFSLGILAILLAFHFRSKEFWVAVLAYLLTLAPFALTYRSVEGSLWPTTFGGTVGPQYIGQNLADLRDLSLPWYEQAIGLGAPALAFLGILVALGGLMALVGLWKGRPGLLFIPLLGYGYVAASLMIHPLILMSYTPVDVLRHWSSGIPYIILSLAYSVHTGVARIAAKLSKQMMLGALLMAFTLFGWVTYYECERLARPEWGFGGSANLLWTGSSFLLVDLAENPLPLPLDDPRPWEQVRAEQSSRLESVNLHSTNRSEPYHWTTLIFALLGLGYAVVPLILGADSISSRRVPVPSRANKRLGTTG
jgi:4-amino-4-deoxy-L-arabinose transferase-like glycosyltransferase